MTTNDVARASAFVALLIAFGCSGSHGASNDGTDGGDASPDGDPMSSDAARSACEGVDGGANASTIYSDMDIAASGFAEHEGQTVFVVTRSNTFGVIGAGNTTVVGGRFAFHFPKGYERGSDQEIDWFVDADGDGICTDAAGDHTGYVAAGGLDPAADAVAVSISDNHVRVTPRSADLCNPAVPFADMLDLNIAASGFEVHEGRNVHLLTRTFDNGAIFGSGQTVVTGGGFAFHFRRGFERFTYQEVFWFTDEDGDGVCTPGIDHTGYSVTPAFSPTQNMPVDMAITDNHTSETARRADVCVVMNGCQLAP